MSLVRLGQEIQRTILLDNICLSDKSETDYASEKEILFLCTDKPSFEERALL